MLTTKYWYGSCLVSLYLTRRWYGLWTISLKGLNVSKLISYHLVGLIKSQKRMVCEALIHHHSTPVSWPPQTIPRLSYWYLFIYKNSHLGFAQKSDCSYSLSSQDVVALSVPIPWTEVRKKAFKCSATNIWNGLQKDEWNRFLCFIFKILYIQWWMNHCKYFYNLVYVLLCFPCCLLLFCL